MSAPGGYDTLLQAAEALCAARVSSEELTRDAISRIEEINPRLGAVTDLAASSALRAARDSDSRRAEGGARGVLDGIPVLIKDCIDMRGVVCSAGLPFLADHRPDADAPVVRWLRSAGAVILGVSATDPGTFGVRTPAVTHPQAPALTVGGSSGGSAAALAAGFCLGALGTDTGGSIRIPSACCLTAGLKPSYARVSSVGVRPLAPSADHVGPMARRAADLRAIAEVIDRRFARAVRRRDGRTLAIGHAPAYWRDAAPEVADGMSAALDAAQKLGGRIREVALPGPDAVGEFHVAILAAESAAYHFTTFPAQLDVYSPVARGLFEIARNQRGYEYLLACQKREEARRAVDAAFEDVDFLLVPTLPVTPPRRDAESVLVGGIDRDFTWALVRYTALFDHTGHPAVSLPTSVIAPGTGTSVQVVGARDSDKDVLGFAESLERELALSVDWSIRA